MQITVFTPTYNRSELLQRLYDSLCRQTMKNFEWLIVDDGSLDNTAEVIKKFQVENRSLPVEQQFPVRYLRKENGGKHTAINVGVSQAECELFFIVDSDDYLTDDAIEVLSGYYNEIRDDESFAGVSGTRITPLGETIIGEHDFSVIDCTNLEFATVYHFSGDMAEAYRTKVMKKYPFPEIAGERFCPESLVWLRMARDNYKVRYFNQGIYVCDYQSGGLTDNIIKIRRFSPILSMIYYSEHFHDKMALALKFKAAVNYWRFCPLQSYKEVLKMKMLNILSILSFPLGLFMRYRDGMAVSLCGKKKTYAN